MNEYLNELYKGLEPNPNDNVFNSIWDEYERVVLHSLATTFGLDFIVDQDGGDVDTVKSVKETHSFKNQRYAQKYNQRGDYNQTAYHSDPNYRAITSNERNKYNETGKPIEDAYIKGNKLHFSRAAAIDTWHRASLDHIISAHEIHDDPVRMLADIDGIELANDPENLRYTNQSLNSQMKDFPIEEYISRSEENPKWQGVKGEHIPEEVKQRLREEDARARTHYETTISKSYYSSPRFYSDVAKSVARRGTEMGVRQVLGFVFIEMWYACKRELTSVTPGNGINECIEAIIKGVEKGVDNVKNKYKTLLSQLGQGMLAGTLSDLVTIICNIFSHTEKNVVHYIRQAYAAVVQAANIIFINPNDLLIGEQLKMATLVLGSGASVIAGTYVGDMIATTPIGMMPEIGPIVTKFVSVLVGGLLSCTLLIMLDRSKWINTIVGRMNQYTTTNRQVKQISNRFKEIAAELGEYELELFVKECNRLSTMADIVCKAENPEELDRLLDIVYSVYGLENPWDGDFDEFMNCDKRIFDFS